MKLRHLRSAVTFAVAGALLCCLALAQRVGPSGGNAAAAAFVTINAGGSCSAGQVGYYSGAYYVCISGAWSELSNSAGSTGFNAITGGTNTAAAMLVGTGASLGPTGSGTITATAAPASGITGTLATANGGTGAGSLAGANIPIWTGTLTAGDCIKAASSSSIEDAGAACGSGGGGGVSSVTWDLLGPFTGAFVAVSGTGLNSQAAPGSANGIELSCNAATSSLYGCNTYPLTTAGDLWIGGTSGAPARLAAGTSGYVLTSNGASAAPSWQAASGGGSPGGSTYATQYNAGSSTFGGVGPGTLGQVLTSQGASGAPAFASVPVVYPETYGAKGDGMYYFDGATTDTVVVGTPATATSTTPATPSITTNAAAQQALYVFMQYEGWTTAPSVGTQRVNTSTGGASGYQITVNDQNIASAGTVGPVSGTIPSGGWLAQAIALPCNSCAFVSQTNTEVASGNITLAVPTGAAAGNTVLACVTWFNSGSNPLTWPSNNAGVWIGSPLPDTEYGGNNHGKCEAITFTGAPPASFTWSQGSSGATVVMLLYSSIESKLTSATASFASGAAGDPICTAGTGASGAQQCGTIASYVSSTQVMLSYPALAAPSDIWFGYGTDDDAAFSSMYTSAPCSTVGCRIVPGPKGYALVNGYTLPPNRTIQMVGAGSGVVNTENDYINGNSPINVNIGSRLMYLTNDLSQAAITIGGTAHVTNTAAFDLLSDVALIGGAGNSRDGGGADGIDILNWQGAQLDRVAVANFTGDGVYADGMTASDYQDYLEQILLDGVYSFWNGAAGIKIGSSLGVNNLETIAIRDSVPESNGGPGIWLAGANIQAITVGNNVVQWNNVAAANPEMEIDHPPAGCEIVGNYFEVDTTGSSQSSHAITPGQTGCNVHNYIVGTDSGMSGNTGIGTTSPTRLLTNACSGSATLASGTVTVSNACIAGSGPIALNYSAVGGTPGYLTYTQSSGSLVITSKTSSGSTNTADTGTVTWVQN